MDSDDEFFYQTLIDTSDESSDDDSDVMLAAATLIHNFIQESVPRHVGSGEHPRWTVNEKMVTSSFGRTTSTR